MVRLADVFNQFGATYLEKYGSRMLPSHLRALSDISKCRTPALGSHVDICEQCRHIHIFHHSCCNRSCPRCQGLLTAQWVEKKKQQLSGFDYFHIVFTLPKELQPLIWANQKQCYSILFKAASYALKKLMADPRYGGGMPGMLMVLHTAKRDMGRHPHIHCLMPAGVIQVTGQQGKQKTYQFKPINKKFLLPRKPLAKIFRARWVKLARKAFPKETLPQTIWQKMWMVYIKPPIKNNQTLIEYLSRYLHKTAITDKRIIKIQDGNVTFKYKPNNQPKSKTKSKSNNQPKSKYKTMTLPAHKFMARFLQHVLPRRLHKIRYYGFMAPAFKKTFLSLIMTLAKEKVKTNQILQQLFKQDKQTIEENKLFRKCPACKVGKMTIIVHFFLPKHHSHCPRPPPIIQHTYTGVAL